VLMPTNKPKYPTEKELKDQGYSVAEIQAIMEVSDKERREEESRAPTTRTEIGKKKGGSVKSKSASRRGDGCVTKGRTRGKMV